MPDNCNMPAALAECQGDHMAHLELDITDTVATITFNNPPLQVMMPETVNELNALLPRLEEDDIRAVILTGSDGEFFIRHFSVEELDAIVRGEGGHFDANIDDVFCAVEDLSKPVIAALNGSAAGGGLELAMACDIRVTKDGPWQFGLPEVTIGILPGAGGTQRLPALVGRNRALDMMLRGRLISPVEAYEYGLVEELVPADSEETALARARRIAAEIARHPPRAVAHIKALARKANAPVDREILQEESRLFMDLMQTDAAQLLVKDLADNHRNARETGKKAAILGE
jgi:enoyl-CoA hydratase